MIAGVGPFGECHGVVEVGDQPDVFAAPLQQGGEEPAAAGELIAPADGTGGCCRCEVVEVSGCGVFCRWGQGCDGGVELVTPAVENQGVAQGVVPGVLPGGVFDEAAAEGVVVEGQELLDGVADRRGEPSAVDAFGDLVADAADGGGLLGGDTGGRGDVADEGFLLVEEIAAEPCPGQLPGVVGGWREGQCSGLGEFGDPALLEELFTLVELVSQGLLLSGEQSGVFVMAAGEDTDFALDLPVVKGVGESVDVWWMWSGP
ncbi:MULTISPECIES: hypothetical protein [unclassified Streptomyces]|uniref:hypothetical protein n=1 Tax=unclassified Streptomyces TaxID=2593676 RepID=UPI000CD55868|nr:MULTISPECIES: hypothetical protein [unclassified Streptomyces]